MVLVDTNKEGYEDQRGSYDINNHLRDMVARTSVAFHSYPEFSYWGTETSMGYAY